MNGLSQKMRGFERRVRFLSAWRWLAIGGAAGSCLSLIWAALDFFRIRYAEWWQLLIPVGVGLIGGFLFGLFRRLTSAHLADSIDRRAGLENRIGTAFERASESGEFDEALVDDALARLGDVKPPVAFPFHFSRWHGALVLLSIVAAALFLLGNSPILMNGQKKMDRMDMQQAAPEVERVAKPLLEKVRKDEATQQEKELAKQLQQLHQELEKGRVPKEEALAKANELAKQAEELAKQRFANSDQQLLQAETALSKLEQAKLDEAGLKDIDPQMLQMTPDERDAKSQDLQNQINKLKNQLTQGNQAAADNLQARKQLQGKLEEMAQRIQNLRNQLTQQGMSDAQKKQMEEQLAGMQALSKKLQDQLQKLAEKLPSLGMSGKGSQLSKEQQEELAKQLEKLEKELKDLKLSQQAQEMLKRMANSPEMQKIREMMRQMKQLNQSGKQGMPNLTADQVKEMMKQLEDLAKQLKDQKAMDEFLKKLRESMKEAKGG